jgi:hypothetical protein
MKNIPKFLLLTAGLTIFTILPGKESSAQDAFLPDTTAVESTDSDNIDSIVDIDGIDDADETDSIDGIDSVGVSLRSASFNEDAAFAEYENNILQEDTYTLKLLDVEDGCSVSFKSSDTDVLTVKQLSKTSCSYTGVGYGKAKITVQITKTTAFIFKEKKTLRATVNVTPRAVSVMFRQSTRKVTVGKKVKLPLTIRPSISEEVPVFKSANSKIAAISKAGKLTAKKVGSTYVTAAISNGQKAKCKISVIDTSDDDDDD